MKIAEIITNLEQMKKELETIYAEKTETYNKTNMEDATLYMELDKLDDVLTNMHYALNNLEDIK